VNFFDLQINLKPNGDKKSGHDPQTNTMFPGYYIWSLRVHKTMILLAIRFYFFVKKFYKIFIWLPQKGIFTKIHRILIK